MNKEEREKWFKNILYDIAESMDSDPEGNQQRCMDILEEIYQQGVEDATAYMG